VNRRVLERVAWLEIKQLLQPYLSSGEAEVCADALVSGLLRGGFDARFDAVAVALRIALRERGYSEADIQAEIERVRKDIKIVLAPYLKH